VIEVLKELAEYGLVVAVAYFAVSFFFRRRKSGLSAAFERRKFLALVLLTLAVTAIKVSEDVLSDETGPIDKSVLLFIHRSVPSSLTAFFQAVTFTGSSNFLFPLVALGTVALWARRRRAEAMLLVASPATGALVIFLVKATVGRARPALWTTDWYWGSSFPSGHTLATASVATAVVLCIDRVQPSARRIFALLAGVWVLLVALSRLVLGVHWPTDVLVAACVGAIIPFVFRLILAPAVRSGGISVRAAMGQRFLPR
jgi:undecaprenyl-diphosphatase